MSKILTKLFDQSGYGGMSKLAIALDFEHQWGGFARATNDVSNMGIRSFFKRYGTTEVGFKKFEHPALFAGYYFIPPEPGKKTAHTDRTERIAVFQRVPLFREKYRNIVLVKSYPGAGPNENDLLSLLSKSMYLDGLVERIRDEGGLPVHQSTQSPI